MPERRTYADKLRAGEQVDLDDEIDAWHEGDYPGPLWEFLGWTKAEYAQWVAPGKPLDSRFVGEEEAPRTPRRRTYSERKRAGESVDVDAEIQAWVESDFPDGLAEWLGMSDEEYEAFVEQRMYGPDTKRER